VIGACTKCGEGDGGTQVWIFTVLLTSHMALESCSVQDLVSLVPGVIKIITGDCISDKIKDSA
jgi:hypothetical protein